MNQKYKYIIGICAANSGCGKTHLIEKLIPELKKNGLIISAIKHAHHKFDIDIPGKDSFRIKQAGAFETLIFNQKRSALITEHTNDSFNLEKAITNMSSDNNIILVEGLKSMTYPKIEVYRENISKEKLFENDSTIIAVASDFNLNAKIKNLDLNNYKQISDFIVSKYNNE